MKSTFTKLLLKSLLAICIGFCLFGNQEAQAQQDARYSHYMFNGLVLNPAYAGKVGGLSLLALYRTQWVGLQGAPRTIALSGHTALGQRKQVGVGGWLEYDQIGVHDRFRLYGTYAYKIPVGAAGTLSLGVQGGALFLNSKFTQVQSAPEAGVIDQVFREDLSQVLPNFGVGTYYHTNRFYLGLSAPHLLNNTINTNGDAQLSRVARQYRHYLLTGGLVLPVGSIDIMPSFLVKAIPGDAPIQADLNLNAFINRFLWLGASFRLDQSPEPESLDFIAGVQLKSGMRISFAYDLTLSMLNNKHNGSYEVILGYDFQGKGKRLITPRYF